MIRSNTAARSSASFLALAAVGFIASAPAHARPDPETAPADAGDDQDRSQDRDQIVVTGALAQQVDSPKATAKLVDTPKSVVVLPREVIEQTGSTTLAEALRTVPGITFGAAEGGNPIGDRPFLRGFDSQGSLFVDGVRDPASQTREVFAVEQVQIVRGSDSTLGGRGGAGGSINIISKLPQAGNSASGAASYGTDDYKRITGDVNVALTDTVGVRLAGMWHDQDVAGRDAIWQRRWGFSPSLTIGLGTPTRLTVSYYRLESHELPDSGIPFLYTLANAPLGTTTTRPALGTVTTIGGVTGEVARTNFYGLVDRDFRDTTTDQAMMRVEHDFGTVTLRNTSRYSHNSQEYSFLLPDDSQGNVYGTDAANAATAGGMVWRRSNSRYGSAESIVNQTDLFGTFETGGIKHSFAVGAELAWEDARRGSLTIAAGASLSPRCTPQAIARYYCTSLFNPNPNDPWVNYASDTSTQQVPIAHGDANNETRNQGETQAVYGFDSIPLLPSLILNLGLRYDRFKSTQTPSYALGGPIVRVSRTDELVNWQAGLVFKPSSETSLYASYATSATPPNALLGEGREDNALGGSRGQTLVSLDDLKPQKTKTYEVGAKASLFGERLALGAALFQTEIANARVTGATGFAEFIGSTRIRGFELTANGTILPGWTIFGGFSHLDPKVVDGGQIGLAVAANGAAAATTVYVPSPNTGRQVPQTTKDSFTIWTNAEPVKGFSIGGGAFYSSEVIGGYQDNRSASQTSAGVITVTPATKTLIRSVPAYWRFDARIGYTIDPHWEISVNVQNLTDKTYFNQVYTSHYAAIAPGRSAFATLSFKY